MSFNEHYLAARKTIRTAKRGPGRYTALHPGTKLRATAKKADAALTLCAMLVAKRRVH